MGNLTNKRIAIAGSRKMGEMCTMVQKKGGIPLERPLQETVKCSPDEMKSAIETVVRQGVDWSIFTTGIGTTVLFEAAESLGLIKEFKQVIGQSRIASRGYKTVQALKKYGFEPEVVDGDGTNAGLMSALKDQDINDKNIFLQLHGEHVPALENWLEEKGVSISYVLPYKTTVPQPYVVSQLVDEVIAGNVKGVLFTASPQVRVLFQEASVRDLTADLANAFNEKVVAGSVGKVTTGTLNEHGVIRVVSPEHERMGALVVAVDEYFKAT
ncbi:uroporphyrinogen-III synthase [Domibacillus epiphyticus]|uniref:Uroporphyrinogen-III synthase n=1 Tax=Domibacillus epiphyticus TaxID=1714355 RepID=A0A1V2AA82_9BACI|nr:uroporphyrinogen-III synthase [Domibacillus epiphyticus]OMP67752.1 uroporphyrinogen-III synthase [Domibacillus epiphyticus]